VRKQRILIATHEELVPGSDFENLADNPDAITEYHVYTTLSKLGHEVWMMGVGSELTELRDNIRDWKPHVVFNLLEQFSGIVTYDYYVVAYLELIRQRYTGCNPRGLMLSRDKVLTKQVLAAHRVPTPAFLLIPFGKRFREPRRLRFPLFVKSATEDASYGISQASVVADMATLRERVEFIHEQVQSDALVEEYIEGRELYLSVLGNSRLTTYPVWEMDFGTLPQEGIATRKVKWDRVYQEKHGITTGPARNLTDQEREQLARLAKRVYRALHLTGYARMDFRMRDDGAIYLLEANANPNISNGEDFADSARKDGVDYATLLERIVNLGLSYMPEWRMFE
jgi:D-alanine-D-alanine ligase